jgi:hypothetical protein
MGGSDVTDPMDRYNLCLATFGPSNQQEPARDFPILQAYADHFVIGTFFPYDAIPPRTAAPIQSQEKYGANPAILKLVKCCFHNQFQTVNVRAGGEWVAVGQATGFLHHIVEDPSTTRCVQSCDPTQVLMNSRSVGLVAPGVDPTGARLLPGCTGMTATSCMGPTLPDRNSPLAMRNPMFSYVTFNGSALPGTLDAGVLEGDAGAGGVIEAVPPRDDVWKFSTRGQFTPYVINIASSSSSVSPQSMVFVEPMGQLAVIDGSALGLIMIDLNAMAEAHTPYN